MDFMLADSVRIASIASVSTFSSVFPQRERRSEYPRMTDMGVRSSWLASEMKLLCLSNASCKPSSMVFMRRESSSSSSCVSTGSSRADISSTVISSILSAIFLSGASMRRAVSVHMAANAATSPRNSNAATTIMRTRAS